MTRCIDQAVERLCELLTDFPLEWEPAAPSDDPEDWHNEVRHRGAGVSVCWDSSCAGNPFDMAINFSGNQAWLCERHAMLVYEALVVMMCSRVEMLPPPAEEAA